MEKTRQADGERVPALRGRSWGDQRKTPECWSTFRITPYEKQELRVNTRSIRHGARHYAQKRSLRPRRQADYFDASSFSGSVPRIQKHLKIERLHWRTGCSGRGPSMTNAREVNARFASAESSPDAVRRDRRAPCQSGSPFRSKGRGGRQSPMTSGRPSAVLIRRPDPTGSLYPETLVAWISSTSGLRSGWLSKKLS